MVEIGSVVGAGGLEVGFRSRVILLGASNIRRSMAAIVGELLNTISLPADIVFVCGHGRSYGHRNRVLGWSLPGIMEADWGYVWTRPDDAELYALVTDVGNDLMYDTGPDELSMWVENVIARLASERRFDTSKMMLMGLPLESTKGVGALRFQIFRKIFFPSSRASRDEIFARAEAVDGYLESLSARYGSQWLRPRMEWYGYDPIHIRKGMMKQAWGSIIRHWIMGVEEVQNGESSRWLEVGGEGRETRPSLDAIGRFRLAFSRAKRQTWFRLDRGATQPFLRFEDGTQVSLY